MTDRREETGTGPVCPWRWLGMRLLPAGPALVLAAALILWWRGGLWVYGELPTHGMAWAVAASTASIACYGAARWLSRPSAPRQ